MIYRNFALFSDAVLRHRGKSRTYIHNLRLAAMLSFVAGMVNICGVLAVHTLTTNVTGHFAFFAEQVVGSDFYAAFTFLAYILAFLGGAFIASFFSELVSLRKSEYAHVAPMLLETAILLWLAASGRVLAPIVTAVLMLFAMGIQNSLVTSVSSSVVRTTHLTGLFTDLGIELSQMIFYRSASDKFRLHRSIFLRLTIILCFFAGCVGGGFMFKAQQMRSLYLAAIMLVTALLYDNIRYRMFSLRRKIGGRRADNPAQEALPKR